jgi:hypothetical protein
MTLHLACSGRGKGRWEEGQDQVMLSIILIQVIDCPIFSGGEGEERTLFPDQDVSVLCQGGRQWKKKEDDKR